MVYSVLSACDMTFCGACDLRQEPSFGAAQVSRPSAPALASAMCEASQGVANIACKCCAMKSVLSNIRLCITFGCFACTGCQPHLNACGFIAGGLQPASYRSVGLVHTTHKGCSYCGSGRDLDRCDQMQVLSHQKTRLRYMLQC